MDAKETTIEALRAEWERARGSGQKAEMRAAAVAYYRLRAEQRATHEQVATELGLNRWTMAKWWQRAERAQARTAASAEDVATLRGEVERQGPRSPARRYPDELKQRIAEWAKGERARGTGSRAIAEQLGLPWESVSRWMRAQRRPRTSTLRPVRLIAPPAPAPRPALRLPNGLVVEGLDVPTLVELIRRLG